MSLLLVWWTVSLFRGGDGVPRDAVPVCGTWRAGGAAAEHHGGAGAAGGRRTRRSPLVRCA